ncbi:hypothetical protein ACFX2I_030460 [Malus domestica]
MGTIRPVAKPREGKEWWSPFLSFEKHAWNAVQPLPSLENPTGSVVAVVRFCFCCCCCLSSRIFWLTKIDEIDATKAPTDDHDT